MSAIDDSVELLFRVRQEGQADVDRLAASVRNVSTAAGVSTEALTAMESALRANTAAVNAQTAALDGMGAASGRAATGLNGMAGGARVATAELRVLEGSMPIMAAGRFLAQMQTLQPIMAAAFPIFGAVALVGVLDTVADKLGVHINLWGEVTKAQKEATDGAARYANEAMQGLERLAQKQQAGFTAQYGPLAGAQRELGVKTEVALKAGAVPALLQTEIDAVKYALGQVSAAQHPVLNERTGEYEVPSVNISPGQRVASMMGGYDPSKNTPEEGQVLLHKLQEELRAANVKRENANQDVTDAARAYSNQLFKQANPMPDLSGAHDAAEQARVLAGYGERSRGEYSSASLSSTSPAIRALLSPGREYDASMAKATAERDDLVKKYPGQSDQINRDFQLQSDAALTKEIRQAAEALAKFREGLTKLGDESDKLAEEWSGHLIKTVEEGSKGIGDWMKNLGIEPSVPAPPPGYVSPQEQLRLARNAGTFLAGQARKGGPDEQYDAAIAAANLIYAAQERIAKTDEQRLDAEEARKQAIFEADQRREDALEALREKDLEKYHTLADGLFDALHSHTTTQWGKEFALGQAKTLFSNAAQFPLQEIGHILAGAIPSSANTGVLGTLLHGTVFGSDAADPGKQTAQHTLDTVTQLLGLRSDLKAIFTGNANPEAAVSPGALGGGGGNIDSLMYSLPTSGTSLYGLGSAGGVGNIPLLTAALSNPAQLMGGLASGPTAALAALMGTPRGTVGYGSDGTPHDANGNPITSGGAQQVGQIASVGAAAAMGAYAAFSEFSKGGAGGALGGVSALAGMASMIPGAGIVAAPVAAMAGILSSLLSTGPQQRQQQITDYLAKDQYLAPTALNVMQGMNGTYEDFDARGNLRTSTMSAVPTVAKPYTTKRTINGQQGWYNAPGVVQAPYSGGATGTGQTPVSNAPVININGPVQAMDSESFHQFITKTANAASTGEAITQHLQSGGGERLAAQIRYHTN
ncbi:MAG: hypothetical protein ABSH56_11880 [Bryobacteraceae bacterium]